MHLSDDLYSQVTYINWGGKGETLYIGIGDDFVNTSLWNQDLQLFGGKSLTLTVKFQSPKYSHTLETKDTCTL